jgi:hypothetical protein
VRDGGRELSGCRRRQLVSTLHVAIRM